MVNPGKILIVDDDPTICELLDGSLTSQGYEITVANDSFQALELIEASRFNVAILTPMLPGPNGIEILDRIQERQIKTEVIVLTAHASFEIAIEALRLGAYDYILKPFQIHALGATIQRAMEKQCLETKLSAICDLSHEMTFMRSVKQVAEAVLDTVKEVLAFEVCGLMLVDEEQGELDWLAVRGVKPEAVFNLSLSGKQGISVAAALRGEPVYVSATQDDSKYVKMRAETRSKVAVPLKIRERVIGVLNVESAKVNDFSQGDVKLLSTLATQAAIAIENTRLHAQTQQEITERKRAEQEIKRCHDYYRAVVDSLHDQVLLIDRDYRINDANDVFLRQRECVRDQVIGQHCYEVIYQYDKPCDTHARPCPVRQVWETGRAGPPASINPNGKNDHWLDVTASPLLDAKGQVEQVIAVFRNLTADEKLAGVQVLGQELVLSREEQQIAQVTVDSAMFLLQSRLCELWLMDEEEKTLSPWACAGRTESINLYPLPLDDEESLIAAVARGGEPIYAPYAQKGPRYANMGRKNRTLLCAPLKMKGKVIGVLSAERDKPGAVDETNMRLLSMLADYSALALENVRMYEAEREHRRTVEQSRVYLVLSEKLAATGRLAASLAHEINNPLQAIHNSLQLMLCFQLAPDEQREYLLIASEEVERLIGLVSRMLSFARRPKRKMRPINLSQVVEKVLALTRKYLQHHHVALRQDLCPDLPAVFGDPDELAQVFMNIVLNGVDAMPEGGTLHVSSRIAAGGQLAVDISDTGPGIPSKYLDCVFEPFFSSKEDGSGLGLFISHNIVERHGGEVTVQSKEGEGTTFTVWLPAMEKRVTQ
jgi:signal transduction histidine kinase/CheY-like chemotaxis protein